MKKIIVIMLAVVMILVFASCEKTGKDEGTTCESTSSKDTTLTETDLSSGEKSFDATVIEVESDHIFVRPSLDSVVQLYGERIYIGMDQVTAAGGSGIEVGCKVRIVFDGAVVNGRYPDEITKVFDIGLVSAPVACEYLKSERVSVSFESDWVYSQPLYDSVNGTGRHIIESVEDLEEFLSEYEEAYKLSEGSGDFPSFEDVSKKYDKEFFDKKSLITVYMQTNNSSSYTVYDVYREVEKLDITIVPSENNYYDDGEGGAWLFSVVVDKDAVKGCTEIRVGEIRTTLQKMQDGEFVKVGDYQPNKYGAALKYFLAGAPVFREGDTVEVDSLIYYYMNNEMRDNKGYLLESLSEYKTGDDPYEICVPKEIVNEAIKKHFAVELDDTNSEYNTKDKTGYYTISAYGRGYDEILMDNVRFEGDCVIAEFLYVSSFTNEVYEKRELCIKDPNSDDFKIIYAREIE